MARDRPHHRAEGAGNGVLKRRRHQRASPARLHKARRRATRTSCSSSAHGWNIPGRLRVPAITGSDLATSVCLRSIDLEHLEHVGQSGRESKRRRSRSQERVAGSGSRRGSQTAATGAGERRFQFRSVGIRRCRLAEWQCRRQRLARALSATPPRAERSPRKRYTPRTSLIPFEELPQKFFLQRSGIGRCLEARSMITQFSFEVQDLFAFDREQRHSAAAC